MKTDPFAPPPGHVPLPLAKKLPVTHRPAKVRWRLKGSGTEGHLYQGQHLHTPCVGCGSRSPGAPPVSSSPAFRLPLPSPSSLGSGFLPLGSAPRAIVYTLRYGHADWLKACSPTLDEWCRRHGLPLKVVSTWPPDYPSSKFVYVDLLREFLGSDAERAIFIDADVFIHPLAPAMPLEAPGIHARADHTASSTRWGSWLAKHYAGHDFSAHTYRQAGVWACDRESARMILIQAEAGPMIEGFMEQHQWNVWLARAEAAGMPLATLPSEWNRLPHREHDPAWFYHLAGSTKMADLAAIRGRFQLPVPPEPVKRLESPPDDPLAIVYPWLSTAADWEELRYSLRSIDAHFSDRVCPIYILGDKRPEWLAADSGRVRFIEASSYVDSLETGLQLAREVVWMNDDVYLLDECTPARLRIPLVRAPDRVPRIKKWSNGRNPYRRGKARVVLALHHHGLDRVADYSTHTPYLYEREKALKTLETFGLFWKIPFETAYYNHHRAGGRDQGTAKTSTLPGGQARFLNHSGKTLSGGLMIGIQKLFPTPALWEG